MHRYYYPADNSWIDRTSIENYCRSFDIHQLLKQGEIDLSLTVGPHVSSGLEVEHLKTDSFSCYQSTKAKMNLSSPFIAMPEAQTSQGPLIKHLIKERKTLYRTSSLEVVKEMTLKGLGIGVLPKMVAKDLVKAGKLKIVDSKIFNKRTFADHKIALTYPKLQKERPILKAIITEIKKSF